MTKVRCGCIEALAHKTQTPEGEDLYIAMVAPDIEIEGRHWHRPDWFTVKDGEIWVTWDEDEEEAEKTGCVGPATPANIVYLAQLGIYFRERVEEEKEGDPE